MCLLMLRHLHPPPPASAAAARPSSRGAPPPHLQRQLYLLFILLLAAAFFSPAVSSSSMAPNLAPSESLTLQALSSPQYGEAQSSTTQLAPQYTHDQQVYELELLGMRLHRRLGFNLEEAYERLKKSCQQGAMNCRRPAFHIMHEVPSGPNPISNYLPSRLYDRFSSWAPAPPPL